LSIKPIVGATIGRPQIFCRKICRRKAKVHLFSFGKSGKLRFSADERCSPLQPELRKEVRRQSKNAAPVSRGGIAD
jgi:hypothetical protein